MEVLRTGVAPKPRLYTIFCRNCSGMFRFSQEEMTAAPTQRFIAWTVQCPTRGCGQTLGASRHDEVEPRRGMWGSFAQGDQWGER